MVAPTVSTIVPDNGLSLGETFVTITGTDFNDAASLGTVRVLFGTVEALESGVVDSTTIIALTPGGAVGDVDVTVENIPASGPAEPTVVTDGFEYKRPSIATKPDHSTDGTIVVVTRMLIDELRRTVLENTHHDMHPDYADAVSALVPEEKQASSPSLKVTGPTVQEDRFYSVNGRFNVQTSPTPGGFDTYVQPVTVMLTYDYVGVGRTGGEAKNLFEALARYFNRTESIVVPRDGDDPANGTIAFELQPTWEERAEFRGEATRQGVHQFSGSFVIRGVHTVAGKVSEGSDTVEEVTIVTEPL